MTQSATLIEKIINCMNDDIGLSETCTVINAYDMKNVSVPINKTHFTVSAKDNKLVFTEDKESLDTCETNTVAIKINCYTPLKVPPDETQVLVETVIDYLCDEFAPDVLSATAGSTEYDTAIKAYKIPCTISFRFHKCTATDSKHHNLTDAAKRFCRYHLADEDMHVSDEDRVFLDQPFVLGTYTGDGVEDGQYIDVGFVPSLVIVLRNSFHVSFFSTTDYTSYCNVGLAMGSSYTRGLVIKSTGFRARSIATSNATTTLNDLNGKYAYIAFR